MLASKPRRQGVVGECLSMGKTPNGGVMTEVIFLNDDEEAVDPTGKIYRGATLKGLLFCF